MIPFAGLAQDHATQLRPAAELGFVTVLITLSIIDLRIRRLPDRIVLPTLWVGLVLNTACIITTPASAVLGAAAGYLSLWLLAALHSLRAGSRGPAFGGGDLKVAAMIGAWLGVQALPAVLLVAFVTGTCAVLPGLLFRRLKFGETVAFGPALAVGGAAVLVAGNSLAGWLTPG